MKILPQVTPSAEQLPIVSNPTSGVTLIRGAAGSGKTTTALLMLRQLSTFWTRHLRRVGIERKPRVLVLTYNKTLRGYIEALAEAQIPNRDNVEFSVKTFGNWSRRLSDQSAIIENSDRDSVLCKLGAPLPLDSNFLLEEVEYCLGRFGPVNLPNYLSAKRVGRGLAPRMDVQMRKRLIDEVINPYIAWKSDNYTVDWNDLALDLLGITAEPLYDIIVADEAQDFSANQLRAIHRFAASESSVVFVLDAAQRIYPRGCTWAECGITVSRTHRLSENHRNTKQICEFAAPLLDGIDIGDDGTLPNLSSCRREGSLPKILEGNFSGQMEYSIAQIRSSIDLSKESVAFLHPKGGGWFDHVRQRLAENDMPFIELSGRDEWPVTSSNIGLSTMHSGKGLEFDHVFLLGLNAEVLAHGGTDGDTRQEALRRTLAMAITRARLSVTLGTKTEDQSDLFDFFKSETFDSFAV